MYYNYRLDWAHVNKCMDLKTKTQDVDAFFEVQNKESPRLII